MPVAGPRRLRTRVRHGTVGRLALAAVALAAALAAAGPSCASETVDVARPIGHPRGRFPLALYLVPSAESGLDETVRRAVADWNRIALEGLGVEVFRWHPQEDGADVVVRFVPGAVGQPMGYAHFDVDDAGAIRLPVRIDLAQPVPMGTTSRETVLLQVAAHEMGHALGLPHTDDPDSIMCCVRGRVDLRDAAVRQRYLEARRHPDVRSVLPQLLDLYPRFWAP